MNALKRPAVVLRVLALAAGVGSVMSCFSNRQNEGATLYATHCSNCHGAHGEGLKRLIPPLAGADYLVRNRQGLACLVRKGLTGPLVVNGVDYNQIMPAGDSHLTDSQITNILNFVQTSWGNTGEIFTIREVSEQLRGCGASDGR